MPISCGVSDHSGGRLLLCPCAPVWAATKEELDSVKTNPHFPEEGQPYKSCSSKINNICTLPGAHHECYFFYNYISYGYRDSKEKNTTSKHMHYISLKSYNLFVCTLF